MGLSAPWEHVTGASVHVHIHRNSTYVQKVIWSVYKTGRPKHPHLKIWWYQRCPQGPASRPGYLGSFPFHGHDTSTTTSRAMSTGRWIFANVTITAITALMRQDLIHCRIRYPPLVLSLTSAVLCLQPFPTGFYSLLPIWLDSIVFRID